MKIPLLGLPECTGKSFMIYRKGPKRDVDHREMLQDLLAIFLSVLNSREISRSSCLQEI